MEVQVRERLVGALVLVAIVVLFVPALLKGPRRTAEPESVPAQQSVEVDLRDLELPAQEDRLVPEPEQALPEALPVAESTALPAPAQKPDPQPDTDRAPPAKAPVTAGQAAWAVQLGAFSARDKAESLVRDLRQRGYSAFVLEYRAKGKVLHRVRVGPEQDRARADAIADRLRKDGFQPVVAPHP